MQQLHVEVCVKAITALWRRFAADSMPKLFETTPSNCKSSLRSKITLENYDADPFFLRWFIACAGMYTVDVATSTTAFPMLCDR